MVGFVAGLPFMYQMVERSRQIQVPKYLRPRTDTPKLTIGHGGCFGCVYSVRGAGGYQMFGVTPMPIYDPSQSISYLNDFMVFFRPGDIVKFSAVDRDRYDSILVEVDAGAFQPRISEVTFDLCEFQKNTDRYNANLEAALYVD
jgi:urea carboxylase